MAYTYMYRTMAGDTPIPEMLDTSAGFCVGMCFMLSFGCTFCQNAMVLESVSKKGLGRIYYIRVYTENEKGREKRWMEGRI